jgi:hypothetical protein
MPALSKGLKMSNGFTEIEKDTAAARKGIVPDHLVDTYGPAEKAPAMSRFDKGGSTRESAQEATDARRARVPGQYDHQR